MRCFALLLLAAVVVLGTGIAAADEWVIPQIKKPLPAAAEVDVTTFVYPIRMRAADGRSADGGAVSVGGGVLQTVSHLRDMMPGATCEVMVNGTWRPATFRVIDGSPAGDVATAKIATDLAAPKRRPPRYGERVVIYGLKTGYLQCGVVSGPREVSLDANEKGTLNGDSGGGVFSEEGEFVGTIQGCDSTEKRVVKFRPNNFDINAPVAASASSSPPAASSTPGVVCKDGKCWLQQPVQSAAPAAPSGRWVVGPFGRMRWVPN